MAGPPLRPPGDGPISGPAEPDGHRRQRRKLDRNDSRTAQPDRRRHAAEHHHLTRLQPPERRRHGGRRQQRQRVQRMPEQIACHPLVGKAAIDADPAAQRADVQRAPIDTALIADHRRRVIHLVGHQHRRARAPRRRHTGSRRSRCRRRTRPPPPAPGRTSTARAADRPPAAPPPRTRPPAGRSPRTAALPGRGRRPRPA